MGDDLVSLAKHTIVNISDESKKLYGIYEETEEYSNSEERSDIISPFENEWKTTILYLPLMKESGSKPTSTGELPPLKNSKIKRSVITNDININYTCHNITHVSKRSRFPEVRVAEKFTEGFKVCWPSNLAIAEIISAQFLVKQKQKFELDYETINAYYQCLSSYPHHEIDKSMGNLDCLTEWSDFLPPYETFMELPFFFSESLSNSFPITNKTGSEIQITVTTLKSFTDLLRVSKKNSDGDWEEIDDGEFRNKIIKKCIIVDGELNPTYWVKYSFIHDTYFQVKKSQKEEEQQQNRYIEEKEIFYRRYAHLKTDNETKYGNTVKLDVKLGKPCLGLVWFAENIKSTNRNNLGNYTTNADSKKIGYNPISSSKLSINNSSYIEGTGSILSHFYFRTAFPNCPRDEGLHAISFASDLNYEGTDITVDTAQNTLNLSVDINRNYIEEAINKYDQSKSEKDDNEDSDLINLSNEEYKKRHSNLEEETKDEGFLLHAIAIYYDSYKVKIEDDGKENVTDQ